MFTVEDLAELYIEGSEEVHIWDTEKEETVYTGTFNDVVYTDFAEEEVASFGIENRIIVINI